MKAKDLLGKTVDQLNDELQKGKRELMNLRFQKVQGELSNTSKFKIARRWIARLETRISQIKNEGKALGGKKHA